MGTRVFKSKCARTRWIYTHNMLLGLPSPLTLHCLTASRPSNDPLWQPVNSLLGALSLGPGHRLVEAGLGDCPLDLHASWSTQGVVDEAMVWVIIRSGSSRDWFWPRAKFYSRRAGPLPGELGITKTKREDFVTTIPVMFHRHPNSFLIWTFSILNSLLADLCLAFPCLPSILLLVQRGWWQE